MSSPIADRKLIQWTLAYVTGAWVTLEATGEVGGILGWPPVVQLVVLVLLLFGLPSALVIAWYHGEKGEQQVTRLEGVLLSVIAVAGVASAYWVAQTTPVALRPLGVQALGPGAEALDPARYVVFPFRASGEDEARPFALFLHDGLARWDGIDVVDPALVDDVLDPGAGAIAYLEDAREVSRRLGAGRMVLGEADVVGDQLRLRIAIRHTGTGRVAADTAFRVPRGTAGADTLLRRVGDHLLFTGMGLDPGDAPEPGTASLPARVAYMEGAEALGSWRMAEAASRFEEAGRLDPRYARAHLWRAQALRWSGHGGPEVLALAERAAAGRASLTPREARLAEGLLHLEGGRYERACETYATLRDADPRDFAAWHGLGSCRYHDPRVVPDPASPTGWAFAGSHHQAAAAFQRAFELLPAVFQGFSSQAFEYAREVLYTRPSKVRIGRGPPPEAVPFAAYPTLRGDTLAFIPAPLDAFSRGETPGASPGSHWSAVERQRRILRDLSAGWLTAFPGNTQALRAYALTLDLLGDPAALDTLARARATAESPELERRLALEAVPLMIKYGAPDDLGQLRRARSLADSLLAPGSGLPPSPELAAIAALVGRVHRAAAMERRGAEAIRFPMEVPALVNQPAEALLVYAALGGPADSIAHYERRVVEAVENRIPPGEQERVLHELLDRAAILAMLTAPLARTGALAETSPVPFLQPLGHLARGQVDQARATMPPLEVDQAESRPADRTPDILLPAAWLAVQLGDTAAAVDALDATLDALRWLEPRTLEQVVLAAALVRCMALRAELAHARGDAATAARWARAVAVLWDDADPSLEPLVSRMWSLARAPSPGDSGHTPSLEP